MFINIFWNQKLKISSKFDFRLKNDNRRVFFYEFEIQKFISVLFKEFYISYLLMSLLKDHGMNLKSQFLR
jgi:hypothetical protein